MKSDKITGQQIEEAMARAKAKFPGQEHMEPIPTRHYQGVPPKGQGHQWELTNHPEIVHMCVACGQQTKVIWRANGICYGVMDLFQDYKGGPLLIAERPDLEEERKAIQERKRGKRE